MTWSWGACSSMTPGRARIAHVLCGGDIPSGAWVDEQQILDLEREGFLSLLGEAKTMERIQVFLTTGKIHRN